MCSCISLAVVRCHAKLLAWSVLRLQYGAAGIYPLDLTWCIPPWKRSTGPAGAASTLRSRPPTEPTQLCTCSSTRSSARAPTRARARRRAPPRPPLLIIAAEPEAPLSSRPLIRVVETRACRRAAHTGLGRGAVRECDIPLDDGALHRGHFGHGMQLGWGSVVPVNRARSPHNQVSASITSVSTQGPLQYGIGVSSMIPSILT